MKLYPLKPIVTSNPRLAKEYNAHPDSVFSTSACLTPQEVLSLVRRGALFDAIVLVNGEGEPVVEEIGDPSNWDNEIMPAVRRVSITANGAMAVVQLLEIVQGRNAAYGA
jgi:hypothetical protein